MVHVTLTSPCMTSLIFFAPYFVIGPSKTYNGSLLTYLLWFSSICHTFDHFFTFLILSLLLFIYFFRIGYILHIWDRLWVLVYSSSYFDRLLNLATFHASHKIFMYLISCSNDLVLFQRFFQFFSSIFVQFDYFGPFSCGFVYLLIYDLFYAFQYILLIYISHIWDYFLWSFSCMSGYFMNFGKLHTFFYIPWILSCFSTFWCISGILVHLLYVLLYFEHLWPFHAFCSKLCTDESHGRQGSIFEGPITCSSYLDQ